MKVVFINCASNGSTGNIIYSIHKELLKTGNKSYVFYGVGNKRDEFYHRVGNYFTLHFHSVMSKITGKQGYFSFFPTLKLIMQIKKINPEVIHLHNLHGSYLCLPLLFMFLKKAHSKIIITLHDCWAFTGKCPYFTAAGCYLWQKSCGKCIQLESYPKSSFFDCTKSNLKAKKRWLSGFRNLTVTAVSHWLQKTANTSFLKKYGVKCIYNGIDTQVFYPHNSEEIKRKYGITHKKIILGVASDWSERKGLSMFMKISKVLNGNEVIVLVGLTKNQIESLPEGIIGIERTESMEELAELYSSADVFINASKEETFGLVTAEALACGTRAIVFNSTACAEVITNDRCGIVVKNDSELMSAVRNLLNEETKTTVIASRLDDEFKVEKMIEEYMNEYKNQ